MNGLALLGLLLIAYAAIVLYITLKKPPAIWDMAKIRLFRKVLGDRGTVIFFLVFSALCIAIGLWLIIS